MEYMGLRDYFARRWTNPPSRRVLVVRWILMTLFPDEYTRCYKDSPWPKWGQGPAFMSEKELKKWRGE